TSNLYSDGFNSLVHQRRDRVSPPAPDFPSPSIDRPSRSNISSVEVNCRQTFTAVDNTVVSLTSRQDLRPLQELDLAGA
ncbi:hypothetical protein BHM03_00059401, partial [Ensete ventricosum]